MSKYKGSEGHTMNTEKIESHILKTVIFVVLYISYTAIYIARLNLTVASPLLISSFVVDKTQIGVIGGVFSIVYAVGRIINGYASDKILPYIMIAGGLVLTAIGNFIFGMFPPYVVLTIVWGINALGQSMLWSSVLRIISEIYPRESAKQKTSYMVTSVATGNVLGIIISTKILNTLALKFAFIIPGMITLGLALIALIVTKGVSCKTVKENKHISMIKLFARKDILAEIFPAFFHGAIKDNISLWMTVYFVDKFNVNLSQSSMFVLFIPIVGLLGRLVYPIVFKLLKNNEHKVSMTAFAVCVLCIIPIALDINSLIISVACLSMVYALISVVNTSILSIFPVNFAKTGNVASVSGIMDFATYCGAGVGSFIYGIVISRFGYVPMFASWIVICVISIVFTRALIKLNIHNKDTGC